MKAALICVDVQIDFLPGGALGVRDGHEVIDPLVEAARINDVDFVVATRDWHPTDHCSFVDFGGKWPKHCVAHTGGAIIHPRIMAIQDLVVSKGRVRDVEEYSAFEPRDHALGGSILADALKLRHIDVVMIGGLATDYCVQATAIDAAEAGFYTLVIAEACRGVDPKTTALAWVEMEKADCDIV